MRTQGIMGMRAGLWAAVAVVVWGAWAARGATLEETFNQALIAEEGRRDYEAARSGYEEVVRLLDSQRRLAATAVFRLGEVYRKLNRTNDAVAQFERVLRQFPDEGILVQLSQQNLAALGHGPGAADGKVSLAGDSGRSFEWHVGGGPDAEGMTSEEAEEIRRITAMTARSPDLLNALKDGYAPLHTAAANGHLAVVRHLLKEGAAVDVPDKWGESPLQFAVRSGHLAVAEALLDAGANVQGTARATPLHSAVARAYTRIIELLLARGANLQVARDVNVAVPGLESLVSLVTTPLGVTAVQNRLDVAAFLLDRGADPNFCEGESCDLPINRAVSAEMVELLLQRGADATLARPRLRGAIREKQGAILRRLLAAGARPDSTNAVELLLALQVNGANLETVDLLVQHGADVNPVLAEITRRHPVDMLRWALDHGGDPNPPSTELSLLEATGIGEQGGGESLARDPGERIRLLLARGADPNRRFSNGLMLVHALAWQLTPALLGDAKVDLNAVDMQGRTALMWAVAAANRDAVDWLLERGAEVNARDREGATALHIAAARRDLALVKRLLDAKADPAARLELRGLQPGDFLHRAVTFAGLWPRWNTLAPVAPGPSVDLKALRELLPPSAP